LGRQNGKGEIFFVERRGKFPAKKGKGGYYCPCASGKGGRKKGTERRVLGGGKKKGKRRGKKPPPLNGGGGESETLKKKKKKKGGREFIWEPKGKKKEGIPGNKTPTLRGEKFPGGGKARQ